MHKEPRIPPSQAHLEKGSVGASLIHRHTKGSLSRARARQHPLPPPRCRGYTGASGCLHCTGRDEKLTGFAATGAHPASAEGQPPPGAAAASQSRADPGSGRGRRPSRRAPPLAQRQPQARRQEKSFFIKARKEARDSPLGTELGGAGNAARRGGRWRGWGRVLLPPQGRLPGPARRERPQKRKAGKLQSPNASDQLAKKASPRQSCLTIKGARLREQLSSLAGECGNEVRGAGAHRRGTGLAGAVALGPHLACAPSGPAGKGVRVYFSTCQRSGRRNVCGGLPPGPLPPPHRRPPPRPAPRGPSPGARPGPGSLPPAPAGPCSSCLS